MNKWYRLTFSVQRAAVVKAGDGRSIQHAIDLAERQVGGVTSNDVVAVETISEDQIEPEDVFLRDDDQQAEQQSSLEQQKDMLQAMFNNKEHDDSERQQISERLAQQRRRGTRLDTSDETVQNLHTLMEFVARRLIVEAGYPETNHNINIVLWDITASMVSWGATFSEKRIDEILGKG